LAPPSYTCAFGGTNNISLCMCRRRLHAEICTTDVEVDSGGLVDFVGRDSSCCYERIHTNMCLIVNCY